MKPVFLSLLFLTTLQIVLAQNALAETAPTGNVADKKSIDEALDYLNKMGEALRSLNYQGTLVYMHNGQVETMQLIHKKDDSGETERLVHMSGEAREVVRKGDTVTCYMPDSQSVVVGKRRFNSHLLAKLRANFKDFVDFYSFIVGGEDRVAGRMARIVMINPKDDYRYGYRLWLDKGNYLLLKSEMVDAKDNALEQIVFANIDVVDNIPDQMLLPAVNGEKFTWHSGGKSGDDNTAVAEPSAWQIKSLPKGFVVTGHFKQTMPNSNQPADHMVLSDGLASISIYIENFAAESQGFVGASQMGAINIFGTIHDDYKVTVVGEVPENTVKMISESVYNDSPANHSINSTQASPVQQNVAPGDGG